MSAANVYAGALYELAREDGSAEALLPQLEGVSKLVSGNPGYIKLISSPEIPKEERLKLLDEAFKGRTDERILNLMKLLAEKGRFKLLPEVIRLFRREYLKDSGIIEARVISAVELSAGQDAASDPEARPLRAGGRARGSRRRNAGRHCGGRH